MSYLKLRRRRFVRIALALCAILVVLVFDLSPRVPPPPVPDAETAARARDAARTVRESLRAGHGHATLHFTDADLASLARLGSHVGHLGRFDVRHKAGFLNARASHRLLGPIWLNVAADIPPSTQGMPAIALTIGKLPLGSTVSRWLIAGARAVLRWRGVRIPPLDDLVQKVRLDPGGVTAKIYFPLGSGFADDISGLHSDPVDPALTAQIYCRLAAQNNTEPTEDMAVVVRRAFAPNASSLPLVEQNRATFVAIAMYTVEPSAGRMAGDASLRVRKCKSNRVPPRFATRDDLPKHWSLSAALAVAFGDDFGKAMGEWKELADSRPDGSGFSFVDLSADRAGLAAARAAIDPARADAVTTRLRSASQNDLLPLRALALSEGLSEAEFVRTYKAIDSAEFAAAKARIDRVIAHTVGK